MGRERELKFDLGDEAAARRLEAVLGPPARAALQANRFFDAPGGVLRRARLALRLRAEWWLEPEAVAPATAAEPPGPPHAVTLCLKGRRAGDGPLHDRLELEAGAAAAAWPVRLLAADAVPPDWLGRLPPLPWPLAEAVRFTNLRRLHPLPGGLTAELDRTRFGDGRRAWELEVELRAADDPAAAEATVRALLAAAAVAAQPQERSKLQRALEPD